MDFDDALAVVLGLVGRPVSVAVFDYSSTALVMHAIGVLRRADHLDEAATEDERVVLAIGIADRSALILERSCFLEATGDSGELTLRFGGALVTLAPTSLEDCGQAHIPLWEE